MAMVALLACIPLARAGEPVVAEPQWGLDGLASDDLIAGRLMYQAGARTRVGVEVAWLDGIAPDVDEGTRVSFVGTYDVLQEADFTVLQFAVPASVYVGILGGVLFVEDADTDATAGLMTGIRFGDGRASLGVEYQYLLTDTLWQELAYVDDTSRIMGFVEFRF
jgi:hypothetical protein